MVLCGGTHLETINAIDEGKVVRAVVLSNKETNWQFTLHSVTTLRGTVYFKVHPLFDEDPDLEDAGLYMDLGNLAYRPLEDSDTVFLKGRQENDRDARKDEWITEAGLECRFPESHMLINGATAANLT